MTVAKGLRDRVTNIPNTRGYETEKTAGENVELAARRRPSWSVSMNTYARKGNSPYGCGIGVEQWRVLNGGGD